MRPSAKSLVCGEHWSGAASRRFASLVSGCALLVRVFSVVHSVLHVDAYRYAGAQDAVSVRDVLIKEGYAELSEEPYESKVRAFILVGVCVRVRVCACVAGAVERRGRTVLPLVVVVGPLKCLQVSSRRHFGDCVLILLTFPFIRLFLS